eukprot:jgi/Ulvmu1/7816/UM004_0045.1
MPLALTAIQIRPHLCVRRTPICRAFGRSDGPLRLVQSTAAACAATIMLTAGSSVAAIDKVGSFGASGFVFKDTVDIISVEDPDVPGVVLYISEMQRSFSDKLANNFFNDPSQASLGCVATAGIPEIEPANFKAKDGKELISQGRNMSFFQQKTLRLRRLYDSNRRVMVYVAYSTRLTSAQDEGGASTGRYKTSVCAVPVTVAPPPPPPPPVSQ